MLRKAIYLLFLFSLPIFCSAQILGDATFTPPQLSTTTFIKERISDEHFESYGAVWRTQAPEAHILSVPIIVNFSAISSSVSHALDGIQSPGRVGDVLILDVPSVGGPLALVVEFLEQSKSGAYTLSGRVGGIDASSFSLTHHEKNALIGKIRIAGLTIVIYPNRSSALNSSAHTLSLIDPAMLKQNPNDVVIADRLLDKPGREKGPSKESNYLHSSSGSSGSGDVQVLFLFGSDVANQSNRAANIVSEMNFALQQSGVDQLALNKISEAGIKILATDFDGECRIPIVLDMGNRNPPFSNLDSWMASYDADIAFLVTSTDDSLQCAGSPPNTIGRIGGAAFLFDPTKPFGMTTDTYATGDLTAPHEIGHMLGGQHADFTVDSPVPTLPGGDGAHGRENDNAGSWQTIMGGYTTDRCVFDTGEFDPTRQPCERLNFFSNPGIGTFLNGTVVTLGTSVDDGGVNDDDGQRKADMETWLEQTAMETVSGYHPDPSAPTGAPSLAVTSDSCFGQHNASWNSVSGAAYYQLFRSNDSNFSSPMLAADISGTLAFVNVPSNSTWYLRVRACNSGGCGSFSNQQTATWVNFCA